ncbi:MAG: hypothetical protein UZ17_ACD001002433 [Acidobacteria bacterium OLB17]|nr:MAG: hypothetical protein UZ17_ACD001002433 [Acidobacteria bacterium OLB17]MCZ2389955.1 hypothetical protein [Acidobacteriota bacterium]
MSAKTAETHLSRLYLIEGLPEPLTPASSHLQLFDGYIPNTRLRIRSIRDPYSKAWTRELQQVFLSEDSGHPALKYLEIHLNEAEFEALGGLAGPEIRKNRYFQEFDRSRILFDLYLGRLQGLGTASFEFAAVEDFDTFVPPPFAKLEVTGNPFFLGTNLVEKTFAEVQDEIRELIGN